MRQLDITIDAKSEEDAIKAATGALNEPPTNLIVIPVGDNMYKASVLNVDASLLVRVSDDDMIATIDDIQPSRGTGIPLSRNLLDDILQKNDIVHGIDYKAFDELLESEKNGEPFNKKIIAKATAAKDGTNGTVLLHIRKSLLPGAPEPHDRLNYHEREYIKSVVAGQLLATIERATNGTVGTTIRGKPIPPKAGTPAIFKAADNIVFSEDRTKIFAEIDGMVTFVHGVMSVTNVLRINGDVDYETGNIHMKNGSVLVRGSIRPGFVVEASGNVVVNQSVHDARIISGADIDIKEGMCDCAAEAAGSISSQYAQHCRLHAGIDIIIVNNMDNCDAIAGNQIIVMKGKGVIRGGHMKSVKGVQAKQVGNDLGIHSTLAIKTRDENEADLRKMRAEINEALWNIAFLLGDPEQYMDTRTMSEEESKNLKKVLKKRNRLKAKRTRINSILNDIEEERLANTSTTIEIFETAFPGTEMQIHEKRSIVRHPVHHVRFRYSKEDREIVVEAIPIQ